MYVFLWLASYTQQKYFQGSLMLYYTQSFISFYQQTISPGYTFSYPLVMGIWIISTLYQSWLMLLTFRYKCFVWTCFHFLFGIVLVSFFNQSWEEQLRRRADLLGLIVWRVTVQNGMGPFGEAKGWHRDDHRTETHNSTPCSLNQLSPENEQLT